MERITISKYFNYKPIKAYVGLEGRIPVKHKDVYVGVELELENVHNSYGISSATRTEDGSLKLSGSEFVTVPIKMRYLEVELRRIIDGLDNPKASSRCSTHVHMNVRDMTQEEIVNLVLLYMIFERSLYRISGDRWKNNFAVPLTMSHMMIQYFFKYWNSCINWNWNKYTGLNLTPIWGSSNEGSKRIGTVEFRQMHGSTDVEEIMQWCNVITSLKRAAQSIPQDELLAHIRIMNTTSGYAWLAKEVFGSYAKLLTYQPTFVEDVEKCITTLKHLIPAERLGYAVKPTASVKNRTKSPSAAELLYLHLENLKAIKVGPTLSSVQYDIDSLVKPTNWEIS